MSHKPNFNSYLAPFSKDFVCSNCDFLDRGNFCSNCGEKLTVPISGLSTALASRLEKLGYDSFDSWKLRESTLNEKYNLEILISSMPNVYCKSALSGKGIKLELVIPLDDEKESDDEWKEKLLTYFEVVKSKISEQNKRRRKERSKKAEHFIGEMNIRIVRIRDASAIRKTKDKHGRKRKTKTKTGVSSRIFLISKGYRTLPSSFDFVLKWDFLELCTKRNTVNVDKKVPYDLLRHQLQVLTEQCDPNHIFESKNDNILKSTFNAIAGSFVEYFQLLYQYIKRPYYISELVVRGDHFSLGKIINLFFVGLICSTVIPNLITGGYLNTDNLTMFGELPPFLSDLAELTFDFIVLFFIGVTMHVILRLARYKGSFWSLLIGLLFIKCFMQLVDRPYDYLIRAPMHELVSSNYFLYKSLFNIVVIIYFFIYAYFLIPMVQAIYKASRTMSVVAYSSFGVILAFFYYFSFGAMPFSKSDIIQDRFDQLFTMEEEALNIYNDDVVPSIKIGDRTGDYEEATKSLEECLTIFQVIIAKCDTLNQEIYKNFPYVSKERSFSESQCNYFSARSWYWSTLKSYLKGEATEEDLQKMEEYFLNRFDRLEEIMNAHEEGE